MKIDSLTSEQQAVVQHATGPALVFAVAGAGKTTAMVHRIERLVRDGLTPANRILATSFGRANVQDLRRALRPFPHCAAVDVRTLHALGRDIIVQAQRMGLEPHLRLNRRHTPQISAEQQLLSFALAEARRQDVAYKRELDGLDRQDFLDYVDQCKGNLQFASLEGIDLPDSARSLAQQATDPSPQLTWYLDLYRLYEQIRLRRGIVTFADMLMTGWLLLVQHEPLLAQFQHRFDQLLVDEFQDVNLAQSEMLDLISRPHFNLMAIGDDDQTIYEWRGASPRFILDFPERYSAQTYVMRDNFRCPAAPLVLANRVIAQNTERYEKQLQLTRGFQGETAVHRDADLYQMASHIVQRVTKLHAHGMPLNEMAVLVRLNAQTPPIEQALIAAKVPYRVSQPFYERLEIKTLIQYGRLAWLERELLAGKRPLTSDAALDLMGQAWRDIINRPKRYINARLRRELWEEMARQQRPLSHSISAAAEMAGPSWQREPLAKLAADLRWLADQLEQPAEVALHQLDVRLDYQTYLINNSGFQQTGEGRAISVGTFINYAKGKGTLTQFLQHIRQLAQQKIGEQKSVDEADKLTISTIHQAKGLEWPVVFVAQVNQGIVPFLSERPVDDHAAKRLLAEERRLFYVALTRTRRDLHLHWVKEEPLSQFLSEAKWKTVVQAVPQIRRILTTPPETWAANEALLLLKQVHAFGLDRFFTTWWELPEAQQTAVSQRLQQFVQLAKKEPFWEQLKLSSRHLTLWKTIAPKPKGAVPLFAGMDQLARSPRTRRPVGQMAVVTQPDIIYPGMWLWCDAGWGQIKQIRDGAKRPLDHTSRDNTAVRYELILRPQHDQVRVELDLSARRIRFLESPMLFLCTACEKFVSPDQQLITQLHNDAAHDGLSPRYKPLREDSYPLTDYRFSIRPPKSVWQ